MPSLARSFFAAFLLSYHGAYALPSQEPASLKVRALEGDTVSNSWIIRYKSDAGASAIKASQAKTASFLKKRDLQTQVRAEGTEPRHFNLSGFFGTHVHGDEAAVHELAADPAIDYISPDGVAQLAVKVTQKNAQPGLHRVSHAKPPSSPPYQFVYNSSGGAGITAYIIDTGIFINHPDFTGRARYGHNSYYPDNDPEDNLGHGSNVAGILAGDTFGVAKKASLVAVKACDFRGCPVSALLDSMQWTHDDAEANGRISTSVVNLSVGWIYDQSLNDMVEALVASGISVFVAAGNDNDDVANHSPASAPNAITVGAISAFNDSKADFSNYGAGVDIFAPGVDILGPSYNQTGVDDPFPTEQNNGTSQATPHVAGIAAYLMAEEGLRSPAAVRARLIQLASRTGASVSNHLQPAAAPSPVRQPAIVDVISDMSFAG
ncbi:subtilisin-like serine protease-like protein PR1A [Apiospora saccharicola]|uniref:Subtilisin-like serine protease-like protein PR1A n=1 Tax=Apiospora saccharicola TaxID=335842 RepID=A0ABR1UWM6_9PEZI